jgi:hypothetical protein
MTLVSGVLLLGLPLALLLGILWVTNERSVWRYADMEQLVGFAALVVPIAAIVVLVVMISVDWSAASRAGIGFGAIAVALWLISRQWTPRVIRVFGVASVILFAFLLVDIGRGRGGLLDRTTASLDRASAAVAAFDRSPPLSDDGVAPKTGPTHKAIGKARGAFRLFETPPTTLSEERELEVSLETLRLEMGKLATAAGEETEEGALLQTAIGDIKNTVEHVRAGEAGLVDVLREGGETISADLPGQGRFNFALDAFGWVLLALAALAVWKIVERRSSQQMPGPVTLTFNGTEPGEPKDEKGEKGEKGDEKADKAGAKKPDDGGSPKSSAAATPAAQEAESAKSSEDTEKEAKPDSQETAFRTAVLQNLSEPATIPGSVETGAPITDLLELAGGIGKPALKILTSLRTLVAKPGGYAVLGDAVAPEGKGKPWKVLVRVVDRATSTQVSVETVTGKTALQACKAAGFSAAAEILSRSSRIPSWARWSPVNASTLSAYQEEGDLKDLEDALRSDPTSGILLNKVGSRYELDGRQLDALVLYARAVTAHPRYLTGGYRFAVSLNLISCNLDQWKKAPVSTRKRVIRQLERACERLKLADPELPSETGSDDLLKDRFRTLSGKVFARLLDDASTARLPWLTLRRSERQARWPQLMSIHRFSYGAAAREKWLVRSARVITSVNDRDLQRVEARAKNPKSWWQVSYNLACYHSRQNQPEVAVTWLEMALERAGSGLMGGSWLMEDPDLKSLEGLPRFKWVVSQVPPDEEESHA